MVRIARNECVNFYRQMKIDANKDTDLGPFISRVSGEGVSIADAQHQAVIALLNRSLSEI